MRLAVCEGVDALHVQEVEYVHELIRRRVTGTEPRRHAQN
jgi:hypothetical protein